MEMKANLHTNMHANMVQNLSTKKQLLSTLKRNKHGQMACIVSFEIMLEKVPNQLNKSSKACNQAQNSRLAKGLKP